MGKQIISDEEMKKIVGGDKTASFYDDGSEITIKNGLDFPGLGVEMNADILLLNGTLVSTGSG